MTSFLDAEFLQSFYTQMLFVFIGGAVTAVLTAYAIYKSEINIDEWQDFLESIADHKDDIIMLTGVLGVLVRSVAMPHEDWIQVVETGELTFLILAAGLGLGLSRAGKAFELSQKGKLTQTEKSN